MDDARSLTAAETEKDGAAEARYDSFASAFGQVSGQFPQQQRQAGGCDLTILKVDQNGHEKTVPPVPDIVFRLVCGKALLASSVDCGLGRKSLSGRRGSFYVAPANAEATWTSEGNHRLLMIAAPAQKIHDLLAMDPTNAASDPLESLYGREIFDAALPNLMDGIWRESGSDNAGASLLVDGLFMTLLGTLSRLAEAPSAPKTTGDNAPLDRKRLARVETYIDTHLQSAITIQDLANVAGLSPYHFSRCFRAATGVSPHKYVVARRIEASRRLLADDNLCLAQIAFECGFSSQSHFSTVFKDQIGATPGSYRASIRR